MLDWLERNRARFGVAFGEDFLLALRWSGPHRAGKVESRRLSIPGDLLAVSSVEPNIRAVATLAQIAGEALEPLGGKGRQVALALPDLAVRTFVFPAQTVAIRSRIAPRLAYPLGEARIDTWQAPEGWTLAAVIRGVVLRQYEQALEALGCRVVWVDGASLIPIPSWAAEARELSTSSLRDGLRVHIQLYSRHYALGVMRRAEMLDVRTKLRDSDDEQRIAEHVLRLPSLFHAGEDLHVSVQGVGAAALVEHLHGGGVSLERIRLGTGDEEAHLQDVLEILLRRL